MEDRHHSGNSIDQLEAEPQVNQHPGQRVDDGPKSLLAQCRADLGPDDVRRENMEAGKISTLLKLIDDRRIDHAIELIDAAEYAAEVFVAVIQNGRRLLGISLGRVHAGCARQVLGVALLQKLGQSTLAGVI